MLETAVMNDEHPRETGGDETTRPTSATSGMRAGMHTGSRGPACWFTRKLGRTRSMTGRTKRKSQQRQKPAFSKPRVCEVVRSAYTRCRLRALWKRSGMSQEKSPGKSRILHRPPPSGSGR